MSSTAEAETTPMTHGPEAGEEQQPQQASAVDHDASGEARREEAPTAAVDSDAAKRAEDTNTTTEAEGTDAAAADKKEGGELGAEAAPAEPKRLIDVLSPYMAPFMLWYFVSMFKWSDDDENTIGTTSTKEEGLNVLSPASVVASVQNPDNEHGILSRFGVWGDLLLILVAVIGVSLWRASNAVETKGMDEEEGGAEKKKKAEEEGEVVGHSGNDRTAAATAPATAAGLSQRKATKKAAKEE